VAEYSTADMRGKELLRWNFLLDVSNDITNPAPYRV